MNDSVNVKFSIKKLMVERKMNLNILSKKTNINILKMFFIIFTPFLKIKLTHGLNISKALNVNIVDLF